MQQSILATSSKFPFEIGDRPSTFVILPKKWHTQQNKINGRESNLIKTEKLIIDTKTMACVKKKNFWTSYFYQALLLQKTVIFLPEPTDQKLWRSL